MYNKQVTAKSFGALIGSKVRRDYWPLGRFFSFQFENPPQP